MVARNASNKELAKLLGVTEVKLKKVYVVLMNGVDLVKDIH